MNVFMQHASPRQVDGRADGEHGGLWEEPGAASLWGDVPGRTGEPARLPRRPDCRGGTHARTHTHTHAHAHIIECGP